MRVIDLHAHILPRTWPSWTKRCGYAGWIELEHIEGGCARLCRTLPDGGRAFFRDVRDNLWDPSRRLDDMARHGVDTQVLSTVPVMFSYWAQPGDARDLARVLNDHIADLVREHPRHFEGLGTIPMQAPDLACAELERCVRTLGLRGVQIGTNVNGLNLDEPSVQAVFAAAADLGAAVFVHPWDMLGGERFARYWMPWLVGMPTESTTAIMSVLFSGTLDRLPSLRIGFAHGGGSFAGTLGRIMHGFACRRDLFPEDARDPREYLAVAGPHAAPARFWVDSLVHEPAALRRLIDLMHPRRVALGSDYPFPLGEEHPGSLVRSLPDLSPGARRDVLGAAAAEFLALHDTEPGGTRET